MAELAATYGRLVGARIRADWQYRTSFLLFTAGQFLIALLDFLAIAVILGRVGVLEGWTIEEMALLYGTTGVAFGIADMFVGQVEYVSIHIKRGSFDQFLVRPLSPLLLLSSHEFALRRFGKVAQAFVVLGIGIAAVAITWSVLDVTLLLLTIASGVVIFASVWIVTSSLAFWTVETQEIANSFTYGGNFATQYPLDVYTRFLRRLLVIVPLAFVNYVPLTWILDKPDATGLPQWAAFLPPVMALVAAVVGRRVWTVAIRRYRSTGS